MVHFTTDYLATMLLVFVFIGLMAFKRLPSVEGWGHFLESLNTKGGNILILTIFTQISLTHTIRWMYHIIEMVHLHELTENNVYATTGIQFLSTTAFGMFAGALISTLTGISTKGTNAKTDVPPPDSPPAV